MKLRVNIDIENRKARACDPPPPFPDIIKKKTCFNVSLVAFFYLNFFLVFCFFGVCVFFSLFGGGISFTFVWLIKKMLSHIYKLKLSIITIFRDFYYNKPNGFSSLLSLLIISLGSSFLYNRSFNELFRYKSKTCNKCQ